MIFNTVITFPDSWASDTLAWTNTPFGEISQYLLLITAVAIVGISMLIIFKILSR